jgi:hypothetical protein
VVGSGLRELRRKDMILEEAQVVSSSDDLNIYITRYFNFLL